MADRVSKDPITADDDDRIKTACHQCPLQQIEDTCLPYLVHLRQERV